MKDYSKFDQINQENFILNYEEKGDKLIITKANNEKYVMENNVSNEQKIIKKMENQVSYSSYQRICQNIEEKIKNEDKKFIIRFGLAALIGYSIIVSSFIFIPFIVRQSIIVTLLSLTTISGIDVFKSLYYKSILRDLKKNHLFLNIKDEMNDKLKEDENILNKTNVTTKTKIKNDSQKEIGVTLNTIDKISYEDLMQIKKNLNFEDELDYYQIDSAKPKIYEKK